MHKKIGFIGLGTIGHHMAANLAKSGADITVYDVDPAKVDALVAFGAKAAKTAAEASRGRELVISIVAEGDELGPLFCAETGVLAGIEPGTIFADMGTTSLETTLRMADETTKRDALYIDAPIWGNRDHAESGLLTIIAGGDPAIIGRCREPFSVFALNTIHVGGIGDATKMKFIVNLVQATMVQVLAEGIVFGGKMGFSADKILEVMDTRGVASPILHLKGRAMARNDFTRSLALKYVNDGLQLVMNAARLMGVTLPAGEAASKAYEKGVEAGYGEEDFSAVIKVLRS